MIYWPYLLQSLCLMIIWGTTPKPLWWVLPLRILVSIFLIIIAAIQTQFERNRKNTIEELKRR